MVKYIMDFLKSTMFRRFLWNTLAGLLALIAIYVANLNFLYAPILFALFNGLSKEIVKKANEE